MFLLTAILWLLLHLKWFNIHLLVRGIEVRRVLVLPGIWLILCSACSVGMHRMKGHHFLV